MHPVVLDSLPQAQFLTLHQERGTGLLVGRATPSQAVCLGSASLTCLLEAQNLAGIFFPGGTIFRGFYIKMDSIREFGKFGLTAEK